MVGLRVGVTAGITTTSNDAFDAAETWGTKKHKRAIKKHITPMSAKTTR